MARNSSGTYTAPATGNPVVSGTQIATTWANTLVGDLATEMTDSLSRTGKGGMTAPLRTADGDVSAPAHSFTSESGTGWYRSAAGVMRAAILGTYRLLLNATGLQINGTLTVSGKIDRPSLPTVGQQVSASSGTFNRTVNTRVAVTNLTVTITTTGRPVFVFLQPDGSANPTQFGASGTDNTGGGRFYLLRDAADLLVTTVYIQATNGASASINMVPPGSFSYLDPVGAGTYTYTVEARSEAATNDGAYCQYVKLVAFEL